MQVEQLVQALPLEPLQRERLQVQLQERPQVQLQAPVLSQLRLVPCPVLPEGAQLVLIELLNHWLGPQVSSSCIRR